MPAPRPSAMPRTSLALANLRAVVILIVLAFHSALAYLQWNPAVSAPFDSPPYDWRAFPIVDDHRFFGFDLFCAWQDVYLMALMFFLSGLFVWPSLVRKTDWIFVRDRLLRLGLPYAFGIAIVIPVAIYPAFRITAVDPSLSAYWQALLALPFWPNGPLWFLWQLLALNVIAALLHRIAPDALSAFGRWSAMVGKRPGRYYAFLVGVSAVAYVPLALAYSPWAWSNSGVFAVQLCRPLLDAVFFFAGVGIGVEGIETGLVAIDGALTRRWRVWLAVALVSLFAWMGLTDLTMNGRASTLTRIASDVSFVPACAAGCFFLIAISTRFITGQSRILTSLAANAYSLYLVHYVFVVWLQFALLDTPLLAVIKATIVFSGTLTFSYLTVLVAQHVPFGARLIGLAPRRFAGSAR